MTIDRRGFLKGTTSIAAGALLLKVTPGLSATDEVVGKSVLWTPERDAIDSSIILDPVTQETLEVIVQRPNGTRLLHMALNQLGAFRWVAPPGQEIYSANGSLLDISVSAVIRHENDLIQQVITASGRLDETVTGGV